MKGTTMSFNTSVNRRQFVAGAAAAAAMGSIAGIASASASEVAEAAPFETTVDWDAEYDVVVVGLGGAGCATAITAADLGSKVLVLEKACEGHSGGNARPLGQAVPRGSRVAALGQAPVRNQLVQDRQRRIPPCAEVFLGVFARKIGTRLRQIQQGVFAGTPQGYLTLHNGDGAPDTSSPHTRPFL